MSSTKALPSFKTVSYKSPAVKLASSKYVLPEALSLLPRKCNQCCSTLPPGSVYKWCEKCRQKDREKSRRKKERAKLRAQLAQCTPTISRTNITHPLSPANLPPLHVAEASGASLLPQKRKADPDAVAAAPERPPKAAPRPKRTEYQTQDALFDALSACLPQQRPSYKVPPDCLNFHGGFTIVLDPSVDPEARVGLFVSELTEQTGLPLGKVAKYVNGRPAGGYAQHHWCTCRGVAKPKPKAEPTDSEAPHMLSGAQGHSGVPLKRSQSTLATWLAAGTKVKAKPKAGAGAAAPSEETVGDCRLKGQRITIQVQHPGRDF
ncbi:hypothetical protein C8Q78DRAFT_366392 [Trametes maxima]|nr:hypothetical protein C8Q78DRAFT_366392 [Trametes maxima]